MSNFTTEQLEAVNTVDRNVVVRAGAGAGKTKVLVERYVGILENNLADVDGIVAITFTRKAAKEMQERIRARLKELERASASTPEEKKWKEASQSITTAPISTIHSLCSRILREHPVEAGLDPKFTLLEDIDEKELRRDSWRLLLANLLERGDPAMMEVASIFSKEQIEIDLLELLATLEKEGVIGTDSGINPSLVMPGSALTREERVERLRDTAQVLFAMLPTSGKMNISQGKIQELRENWAKIETALCLVENGDIEALDRLQQRIGEIRAVGKLSDEIRALKDCLQSLREVVLDQKIRELFPSLLDVFEQGVVAFQTEKTARRVLAYDDLEHRTAALLGRNPAICHSYGHRIAFLMVDECQDINERQRQIIYLLAGGNAENLCDRRLFVVGDPKQSIYRFRGADVRVFDRLVKDVAADGGKIIDLFENFRSAQNLVTAYNDLFGRLMPALVQKEGSEVSDTLAYVSLTGVGGRPDATSLQFLVLDRDLVEAGTMPREAEAAALAEKVRSSVQEGGLAVRGGDGEVRRARYGDMAVLLRAFTDILTYEKAFQAAGIPYHVAGGREFFDRQEIRDVMALLRFIDNPANERALFGLLRSPFFMVADERLLAWKQAGGKDGLWGGLRQDDAGEPRSIAELLSGLLAGKHWGSVADVVRQMLEATGYDFILLAQFMGIRKQANLMKLLQMAQEYRMDGGGLASFISRAELLAQSEPEAETEDGTGDAIRILTIHKAKGLEFPIVIIPDLHRKFGVRSRLAVFDRQAGLGLKYPKKSGELEASASYRIVSCRDASMEKAELKRLLYVAMTRARDHLLLSAVIESEGKEKDPAESKAWSDWCRYFFGLQGPANGWPAVIKLGTTNVSIECARAAKFADDFPKGRIPEPVSELADTLLLPLLRQVAPLPDPRRRTILLSPSKLKEFVHCPRHYFYSTICSLPAMETTSLQDPKEDRGQTGEVPAAFLGTAFHRALELTNDTEEMSVGDLVSELSQERQDRVNIRVEEWLTTYRQSPLFKTLEGLQTEKEWGFQLRVLAGDDLQPAVRLSGQIDRIAHHPDGTISIVDYKTDRVTESLLQKKTAEYHLQLGCYVMAVQAVFQEPVRDVRLYFTRLGRDISVDLSVLEKTREEIRGIADFLRSHASEADFSCRVENCDGCQYSYFCPGELRINK